MENGNVPKFANHQPAHRERLRRFVRTSDWKELLSREAALARWKSEVRVPPKAPGQQSLANEYLREKNEARVRPLLDEGVRDEDALLEALGDWEAALSGDDPFPVVFLGLVVTLDCSFMPRCIYCNQLWMPRRLQLADYKALLDEVAEPVPPYVYLTGGEPLILGSEVWGDEGIVAHAARLGCAVNVNTNATLITPQVALQLVKVGTAKLHVSIDTAESGVQDTLLGEADRTSSVLKGVFNVQIAREVLGTNHPKIHVNSVLTARNIFEIPELLRFLTGMRQVRAAGFEGKSIRDPLFDDFAIHLIPVGGGENALLRPTAEEWKRFHSETWPEADRVWLDHQASIGVPAEERLALASAFPFMNPYLRVEHGIDLDEYCERAGRGEYWQGALTERCYVSPTQAFVLPDGSQHWCGAHAIRRPRPLGNVTGSGLRENIRANISRLAEHPNEFCTGCAGATCVINQAAERNLRTHVADLLRDTPGV